MTLKQAQACSSSFRSIRITTVIPATVRAVLARWTSGRIARCSHLETEYPNGRDHSGRLQHRRASRQLTRRDKVRSIQIGWSSQTNLAHFASIADWLLTIVPNTATLVGPEPRLVEPMPISTIRCRPALRDTGCIRLLALPTMLKTIVAQATNIATVTSQAWTTLAWEPRAGCFQATETPTRTSTLAICMFTLRRHRGRTAMHRTSTSTLEMIEVASRLPSDCNAPPGSIHR